jgi:LmbE family N-acetylglucosaminyl deacetylase
MSRQSLTATALVILCGCVASQGGVVSPTYTSGVLAPVDVLVFAPHPDDEVIGTGGVLQQAVARGERVRIVFVTNGDGYPRAASFLTRQPASGLGTSDFIKLATARQREAINAAAVLGIRPSSLVFLGYPDGVLEQVYSIGNDAPVRSPSTGRSTTYGPVVTDYHTRAHGRPAPYTRAGALADIEEVVRESAAERIYVTDHADQHPDHRATFDLVRDAIAGVGYTGWLLTFEVHGGEHWPWPYGPTPLVPLESHVVDGGTYPIGLQWPPPIRVPLTGHESGLKLRALMAHRSQWNVDRAYLESFVKSDEVFWTVTPP